MKIKFISDFFIEEIKGGAEYVDDCLITELNNHHLVQRQKCKSFTFEEFDCYIVSNFVELSEKAKTFLFDKRYFIIEHDHKFISNRDPSKYKDFVIPPENLINNSFYRKAQLVFCQSKKHSEILIDNLILNNVANFGCSFWNNDQLQILENLCNEEKTIEYAFLDSKNPIKGSYAANRYSIKKKIKAEPIGSENFEDFMKKLSTVNKFIFFPQVYESFCRLVLEARMLNCSIISNKNLGCVSEPWFKDLKGRELIEFVGNKQNENKKEFLKAIETGNTSLKVEGKQYPKVSIITSMFKGEKHIDKFLSNLESQTVFEHCEFIIVDAASPENEFPIIEKYMKKYSNIKYIRLEEDPGIYGTWNIAIENSTGKYLSNANLDDIRSTNQIEVLVNCLEKNPKIDLAYSEAFVTEKENETFKNNSSAGRVYPISEFSNAAMVKCLPGCMPVWRRSMHDKAGLFDESYKYAGDHEMWLRAVRNGCEFKKIKGTYGLYYMNPEGLSTSVRNQETRFKEEQRVFWEYTDIFGISETNKYRDYFSR